MPEDFDDIIEMGRHNAETTKPLDPYDVGRVREVLQQYLDTASPTVFVCEDRRKLVGFLFAGFGDYDYRGGFYTTQKILYVRPENRGSRAAVLMMKHLIGWSRDLGAVEIMGGNDNGFNSERTAGFLQHFGFEKVGFTMAKRIEGVDDGQ